MIEVEKKFQPTEEQLAGLLKDSEFIGEVVNNDILYDFSDYRLLQEDIRIRNRNGKFELKIPRGKSGDEEIDNEEEIKKYFGTEEILKDFIAKNLLVLMKVVTHRKKYKKGGFAIDVDSLDFGYKVCEIELLVENEDQIEVASDKILDLAKKYNFQVKNLPTKREMFLKLFRPDLHKRFYPSK